jgi:hypothetical protein
VAGRERLGTICHYSNYRREIRRGDASPPTYIDRTPTIAEVK